MKKKRKFTFKQLAAIAGNYEQKAVSEFFGLVYEDWEEMLEMEFMLKEERLRILEHAFSGIETSYTPHHLDYWTEK